MSSQVPLSLWLVILHHDCTCRQGFPPAGLDSSEVVSSFSIEGVKIYLQVVYRKTSCMVTGQYAGRYAILWVPRPVYFLMWN